MFYQNYLKAMWQYYGIGVLIYKEQVVYLARGN